MPLWRVTCPLEERYVVASSMTAAVDIAVRRWTGKPDPTALKNGWVPIRCERVQVDDPWTK